MAYSTSNVSKERLSQWIRLFKVHKPFQSTDVKLALQQQKPQENPQNKFYLLTLKHVGNLRVPVNPSAVSVTGAVADPVLVQNSQDTYYLQMSVNLHNPATGYFGRTYKGKAIKLKLNIQTHELESNEQDWAIFYTQNESLETKAVVELVLIKHDSKNNQQKSFGMGYCIVPLFFEDLPLSVEAIKGSPREIMQHGVPGAVPPKAGSILYFDFKQQLKKFDQLMPLVQDNILMGQNDVFPGVEGSKLPLNPQDILTQCKVVKMQTIFAHNVRISSMNEVDLSFQLFLQGWQKQRQNEFSANTTLEIVERKLTVVPHNSWRQIVQFSSPLNNKNETKDFVIGWCSHVPTLNDSKDNLKDEEVQLDVILGPGTTILGDLLWDQTLVRKQKRLFVKMGVMLTTSEDMVSQAEKKRQEDILLREAQDKVKQQIQNLDKEKRIEQERLVKVQEENKKLIMEKEELERQKNQPNEELLKQTEENKEIEKAKEYYQNKNEEVEQLLQQILKGNKDGSQSLHLPKEILEQGDQSVSNLLRYLIQAVLSSQGVDPNGGSQSDAARQNLLELLKDENGGGFKMNLFGMQGGSNVLQSKELSRQDKINLLRMGIGRNLLDSETEAKLLASEPRIEVEMHDVYKASTISFKFVALKTPITLNPDVSVPQKLYFTFKFFTFKTLTTEKVAIKLPPELEQKSSNNQSQQSTTQKIKMGTQYYLVKLSALQQSDSVSLSHTAIEAGLQTIFDIDPSISKIPDEHIHFAKYLKDRVLTIDIWNGDSLMHFGTCKVPLHLIMRQADPSKVLGQEFDVCEPEKGAYVGGLQLLITNEGRKIPLSEEDNSRPKSNSPIKSKNQTTQGKHKKKVLSKPIDSLTNVVNDHLSSLAQAYEFQKTNVRTTFESEEARKKLRVERNKKLSATTELQNISMNDPAANDWQKHKTLKQIEILRENKKSQILNKVLKESMTFKQAIDVIPGQAQLVHFLVSNPYPDDEVFTIMINDADQAVLAQPEMTVVHNEQLEWQYWFNEGKCPKPGDWDIVSSKNDLFLRSGQQCPLLLKFLSFREPVSEQLEQKQQASPKELRARSIKVTILSRDQLPISTMEVKIYPREQYCDQIFRYYEPQSIKTFVKIPQFVPFALQGLILQSSNKDLKPEINQNGEILVFLQTERAPGKAECYLYLYQDHYSSQMLACCKLEVYSLQCIRQKIQAGPEILYQLQVRSQVKRTIEIFSSNPRLVYPPGKKERNISILQPAETASIGVGVRAINAGTERVRIHCVDINSKELVQAWIFEIEADKPLLQKAYQIETTVGKHITYKFPYTNPLNERITVEVASSKPHLMQVRRESQTLEALENKQIELQFPPSNKVGQAEVFLYINDQSGKITESLLFKIITKE